MFCRQNGYLNTKLMLRWDGPFKGTIPPCSKLPFIPKLYVKRFSTFHWSCWSPFSKKYCVACKKSALKFLINFGFVTSFEDNHYILLVRYIYGAQLIQWFCYSKHVFGVNGVFHVSFGRVDTVKRIYLIRVPKLVNDFLLRAPREDFFPANQVLQGKFG